MFSKKGQSSLEFITIFGIAFAILISIGALFLGYFNSSKESLDADYLQKTGLEIMSNVEKIYFLGHGNRLSIDLKFPRGVRNISIHHYNNVLLPSGEIGNFDYLNITQVEEGMSLDHVFHPYEMYIRFNCSGCSHDNVKNISWFNSTVASEGFRKMRFESKGDWVEISFPQD